MSEEMNRESNYKLSEENSIEIDKANEEENSQEISEEQEENNQDWRKMLEKSVQEVQEANLERNQNMGREYGNRDMNRENNRNYGYNRGYNRENGYNGYNSNYGNNNYNNSTYNNRGYNRDNNRDNREYNNDYRNRNIERTGDRTGERTARVVRKTNETEIFIELNLDGSGKAEIETGIGFFDHMLQGFAKHGFFDLTCRVKGDLLVDCHHTIEDTGIALGTAIRRALGYKRGIKRFGQRYLPMDERLMLCAVDLSGRPYLVFDMDFTVERVGYFDTEMVKEFFYAVSYAAGMNLHLKLIHGSNNHHIIEAAYNAFAKALDEAVSYDSRISDVLSTKGTL